MNAGASLKHAPSRILAWALPYWTRGKPGRETPAELFWVLYSGWIAAFVLKVLGSSWDVSWHFKWLRDDLAPPHLINSVGTAIAVALTIIHGYTGYGVDKIALRLIQWGTGIFLVAVPLDLINHRINGLDITSWSPSHMMLYFGTGVMIAGVVRGWYVGAPPGRGRDLMLGALFLFSFEDMLFPNQHQEYGVLSVAAWDRGTPYAEPILLQFAADQLGRPVDRGMAVQFSLPMPEWLYPVYAVAACLIVLVIARRMVGRTWTATAIAAVFVAYRCVIWPLLTYTDFPPSAVPFFLVVGGLCVDLVFLARLPYAARALAGAVVVTAGAYGALYVQGEVLAAPPFGFGSAPVAAALLAVLWLGAEVLMRRLGGEPQVSEARVSVIATP
ncbi:hypothetical protein Misp01_29270 [Microtetraspora sp. NBRC 13810]|uniref:hypothetical protein n=1 Tax=Microtetraspora sp. NBRC 13810 TaxID=3030990 RepID=UPI0024A0254B|nr:hypothetical protein [Microtetraspora sp. NBRC 13810]GLW07797.1 hypothetical protein Misp01_29270 [Microtetraspora sp. NBRC 13810]